MRSTAIGFGAETTREDQIAIGDGASTFTLRGLSSAGSIKAQTVSSAMVTVDKDGNVATASRPDTGGIAVNAGDIAGSKAGAAARDAGIANNVVCLMCSSACLSVCLSVLLLWLLLYDVQGRGCSESCLA